LPDRAFANSSEGARPAALMLAPETPYPMHGGGALRTASLLHYLAQNHDVDLIVFRQPGAAHPAESIPPGMVRRLTAIDLPANRRGLAARALRNSARVARRVPPLVDRFAGFEAQIDRAIEGRRYAIGVVEHSWCAAYHNQIAPACAQTVLDLHNIESTLHARCAASEPPAAALAHRIFQQASLRFERRWLPCFSQVLAPSESDAAAAAAIAPSANVRVYPNAIPLRPLPSEIRRPAIVFSGNMEYHPNRAAVRFFRRQVWPQLRDAHAGLVWRLVGKNPQAVRTYTGGDPQIEVAGEVEDAILELARAEVAIVPLLSGSGTRLKILEAWSAGTPVVSTTIGAEGLPVRDGQHLLLADGAAAFTQAVARALACKELRLSLAAAGRLLLEKEFTWEKAWGRLAF
jgi:glycosyltransferase involved in cell wall biosynthesis